MPWRSRAGAGGEALCAELVAEDAAVHGVLEATTTFLARLASARSPTDRALTGAAFDAAVWATREDLVREYALAAGEADRLMARALEVAATLVAASPTGR